MGKGSERQILDQVHQENGKYGNMGKVTLREKCPNTEFFLVRIFLYSVRIQENTDQKNSVFVHFSRSVNSHSTRKLGKHKYSKGMFFLHISLETEIYGIP